MQPGVVIPSAFVPELSTQRRNSTAFRRKSSRSTTCTNCTPIGKTVFEDWGRHELWDADRQIWI